MLYNVFNTIITILSVLYFCIVTQLEQIMGNKQSKQNEGVTVKHQRDQPLISKRVLNTKLVESLTHNFNVQKIIAYWVRKEGSSKIAIHILNNDILGLLCKYSVTSYRYIFGYGQKKITDKSIIHNAIFVQKENLFCLNMKQLVISYDYDNMYGQANISKIVDGADNVNHFDEILISNGLASEHCFIMKNNTIYALGRNHYGQLGINRKSFAEENPIQLTKVPFKSKIVSMVCGAEHSLFLSLNGKIFSCGQNKNGQLGRKLADKEKVSYEIKQVPEISLLPKRNKTSKDYICKQIDCTRWTSFALIDDAIYAFGANDCGLLGIGKEDVTKSQYIPLKIVGNNHDYSTSSVIDMKCGICHIVMLTANHDVFVMGQALAIGCGEARGMRAVPTPILSVKEAIENVKKIACGDYHCILLTFDDDIVTFGKNQYGQCLNGKTGKTLLTPTLIKKGTLSKKRNIGEDVTHSAIHIFGATGSTLIGIE